MGKHPTSKYPDEPKSMRYAEVRAERSEMLTADHMAPLVHYVAKLRERGSDFEVPHFDPLDGGVEARALFLQEKPGPKTSEKGGGSGFISRNNDDGTAPNTFKFMNEAGIPREKTALWNVIPWWNGTMKLKASERRDGIEQVEELIALFPQLRAIVLVGEQAKKAEADIIRCHPHFKIFRSPHPANLNRRNHRLIPPEWCKVKAFLDATDAV